MREKQNISASLGLTQEELAMFLQVTRSRVSLYELGLRPLSKDATLRLTELTLVTKEAGETLRKQPKTAYDKKEHELEIQKGLTENAVQQELLSRKIEKAEKKHRSGANTLLLARLMAGRVGSNPAYQAGLVKQLERKASTALQKDSWSKIRQYQIRLEALKHEEKLLRQEIGIR